MDRFFSETAERVPVFFSPSSRRGPEHSYWTEPRVFGSARQVRPLKRSKSSGPQCAGSTKRGFLHWRSGAAGLNGGDVFVDASESSQFLSGILIAAPGARGEVRVEWSEPAASWPYVEITLAMMKEAGIRFERPASNRIAIPAPQVYAPGNITVEGDCSSASYFWGAAALTGGEVVTSPVSPHSLQGDCRFLGVLDKMGCRVIWEPERGLRKRTRAAPAHRYRYE